MCDGVDLTSLPPLLEDDERGRKSESMISGNVLSA
jgi:hypothetical protein